MPPRLRSPVALPPNQIAITQGFNAPVDYSRLNANRIQAHEGVDFAPTGAARDLANIPIVAVQNATVTSVRRQQGGYGNYVQIRFDDGHYGALYAHLQNTVVRAGQHLREGDVIGMMGSTGRSTGRHLHFNLLDLTAGRGNYIYPQVIDPTPFLEIGLPLIQRVNDQPVRNIRHNQYQPQATVSGKSRAKPEQRLSVPHPVSQGDYPPNMPGGTETRITPISQEYVSSPSSVSGYRPPSSPFWGTNLIQSPLGFEDVLLRGIGTVKDEQQGTPSLGQAMGEGHTIGEAITQGIFAQGLQPDGTFDLLQAITGKSGDEREQYLQDKAPYIVLAIILVLLFVLGTLRLIFAPKP